MKPGARVQIQETRLPQLKDTATPICDSVNIHRAPLLKLVAKDDRLWKTAKAYPPRLEKLVTEHSSTLTLRQLCEGTVILKMQSRIALAVLLATSVLHLGSGPWLPTGWSKDHIIFLQLEDEIILRPLVAVKCSDSDDSPEEPFHEDPVRLSLGIVLLELFLQKSIEHMRDPDEPGERKDCEMNRWYTALRVKEKERWLDYEEYAEAIEACLQHETDMGEANFAHPAYTDFMYNNVLAPLERVLFAACNISPPELDKYLTGFKMGHLEPTKEGSLEMSTTPASPRESGRMHSWSRSVAEKPKGIPVRSMKSALRNSEPSRTSAVNDRVRDGQAKPEDFTGGGSKPQAMVRKRKAESRLENANFVSSWDPHETSTNPPQTHPRLSQSAKSAKIRVRQTPSQPKDFLNSSLNIPNHDFERGSTKSEGKFQPGSLGFSLHDDLSEASSNA